MSTDLALQLLIVALNHTAQIGEMIARARAEGRDISPAELDGLRAADDAMRLKFQAAIDKAKGASV